MFFSRVLTVGYHFVHPNREVSWAWKRKAFHHTSGHVDFMVIPSRCSKLPRYKASNRHSVLS
jgi:hypothetical protein